MDNYQNIYLKFILDGVTNHVAKSKVIAALVYDIDAKNTKTYNFCHPDFVSNCDFKTFIKGIKQSKIYVNNKKSYSFFLKNHKLIDVNLFDFIEKNELNDEISCHQYDVLFYRNQNLNNFNKIIPLSIHQLIFDKEVKLYKSKFDGETQSYCFKFFNDVISNTLFEVERNGLKVDESIFKQHFDSKVYDGFVYSEYYIYNPTGRPSNRFDGVNYAALNKENGCRSAFISRYGTDGFLFMIDFTGFHPYIVANLIGYDVPENETIYEHLAKQYFNVNDVSSDLLGKSKKLTMVNLYGEIKPVYLKIPYFEKIDKLKDQYWNSFVKKGYVTTPIYKRKITDKHIEDANKNKLFSYIIQSAETEYGINSLKSVNEYVTDKEVKSILYTYDSILFDVNKSCGKEVIKDIVQIVKNKKFKVKTYFGNNYQELQQVII